MAVRRLSKELDHWEGPPTGEAPRINVMPGELEHWTVKRDPENPLCITVILSPSDGPFHGHRLAWRLNFPSDYPFKQPKVQPVGKLVNYEDVRDGMDVSLRPPGCAYGVEFAGTAHWEFDGLVSSEEGRRLTVEWKAGTPELGAQTEIRREWWDSDAEAVDPAAEMFHPFFNPGFGLCQCGINNTWAPNLSFSVVLAFVRVALESPDAEANKNVYDRVMCFCRLNPSASRAFDASPEKWSTCARERISNLWMPLCLTAISTAGPAGLAVECTNLAGANVGRFEGLGATTPFAELRALVHDLPAPQGAKWRAVLPDSTALDLAQSGATLGEIFGL